MLHGTPNQNEKKREKKCRARHHDGAKRRHTPEPRASPASTATQHRHVGSSREDVGAGLLTHAVGSSRTRRVVAADVQRRRRGVLAATHITALEVQLVRARHNAVAVVHRNSRVAIERQHLHVDGRRGRVHRAAVRKPVQRGAQPHPVILVGQKKTGSVPLPQQDTHDHDDAVTHTSPRHHTAIEGTPATKKRGPALAAHGVGEQPRRRRRRAAAAGIGTLVAMAATRPRYTPSATPPTPICPARTRSRQCTSRPSPGS